MNISLIILNSHVAAHKYIQSKFLFTPIYPTSFLYYYAVYFILIYKH